MSEGNDKSKAESGITAVGDQLYNRGKQTGGEAGQYEGSFDLGKLIQQYLQTQVGMTPEQQYQGGGDLSKLYYQTTMNDLQNPYASYESNLQPQLQASEDYINRRAQERGLLRSGIPLEAMGRAGVELSIAEADKRMAYRSQALSNAGNLTSYAQGLNTNNLANLQNLYGAQQQAGLQSLNRQAGVASQAAGYQAYPYQASLGNAYSSNQGGWGSLAGTLGAGALAMALPGSQAALIPLGTMVGSQFGSQIR